MDLNDPKWQSYFLWMQARGIAQPRLIPVKETAPETLSSEPIQTEPTEKLRLVFVSDLSMKEKESALVARMASALKLNDNEWQTVLAILDPRAVEEGVPTPEALDALQRNLWSRLPSASTYVIFGPLATRIMYGKGSFRGMQGTQLVKNGMTMLPTYHPRDVLRQIELKRDVWNDLQSAANNWLQ
jgi:hypothetical protein